MKNNLFFFFEVVKDIFICKIVVFVMGDWDNDGGVLGVFVGIESVGIFNMKGYGLINKFEICICY